MKTIAAMLPCYNEEPNVQPLVEKWLALAQPFKEKGYDLQVYCIDDKSTDQTLAEIQAMLDRCPERVHLLAHEQNKGLGGALATAFNTFYRRYASGDVCVLMDGDNSHDPVYALSMIPAAEGGSDCVIASRYCERSQTKGVSGIRLFLSGGARVFYTLLLGVPNVKDYTCGYRLYTYDLIAKAEKAYGDKLVERRSFACMMEVLYKLSLLGARFSEVPFELRYDHKQGESKMRVLKTVRDSVGTAFALRREAKRPSRQA